MHNVASTASGIELIHALTSRDILRLCPEQPPLPASPMDTNSTLPPVPSPVRLIHSGQFSPYPKVASCCVAGNVRHATIQHPSHSLSPTPPHTEGGGSISPQAHVNYARIHERTPNCGPALCIKVPSPVSRVRGSQACSRLSVLASFPAMAPGFISWPATQSSTPPSEKVRPTLLPVTGPLKCH